MAQKASIPKGTRDFSPIEMTRRNYIFDTIKTVFGNYGFQQIETPALENLSTLMGKYGEEGDKLLFKILNSGDYLKDAPQEQLDSRDSVRLTRHISEKGLRYDLTVPFARFVVQHRNDLQLPFRRFQIQPVWRADRPQRGRYREFYQCDADIVGSESLLNEVELIGMIDEVFARLKVPVTIKLNNRKVLAGVAQVIGHPDKLVDITVAIDKIDKMGLDKVNDELREKGLTDDAVNALQPLLTMAGSNADKLNTLRAMLAASETGLKGVDELRFILDHVYSLQLKARLELDFSLARGLNYYTGFIVEVKADGVAMGSISGGGRYDNLTGVFGMPGLSGVGVSFGADRIYDVLETLNLYPDDTLAGTRVLFVNFGARYAGAALSMVQQLRRHDIAAELYPDEAKPKKQMQYANSRGIPYVALLGEDELTQSRVSLKNMVNGEQQSVTFDQLLDLLKG